MNFKESLIEVFSEGTHEYEVLMNVHDLITSYSPSISAECKTQMILLDQSKIELSSLYYMVSRRISKLKASIQSSYDTQYTRLVKLGRPSNAAIEAEIRLSNSDYLSVCSKLEAMEQIKDLINSYLRCIDATKATAIELLRDSRRID